MNNKTIPIIAIIFAVLAAAVVIYFGFINEVLNKNENTNATTNTNSAVSPTAGWKTYTNTALGYSVKYQPTWQTSTCVDVTSVWFGAEAVHCGTEGPTNTFTIDQLGANFNLTQTIAQLKNDLVNPTQTTLSVAGESATQIFGVAPDGEALIGSGWFHNNVYLIHNGRYYHFGYFVASGAEELKTEFANFLSTFTFTK